MQVVESRSGVAWCVPADGEYAERQRVDMRLIGDQSEGTWVLVFLGSAREVLDAQRARQIHQALMAMDAVVRGDPVDVDALFADLTGREPRLPPHLQPSEQNRSKD
jgi:hydrogenase expression/formation protein HypC